MEHSNLILTTKNTKGSTKKTWINGKPEKEKLEWSVRRRAAPMSVAHVVSNHIDVQYFALALLRAPAIPGVREPLFFVCFVVSFVRMISPRQKQ
jgi:hypothetical protein